MKTKNQILVLILLIVTGLSLNACRTAQDHLNLFYKKGGKIDIKTDTIRLTDTIKGKDGKDSLIYKDSIVPVPYPVIKTRWQVRAENRKTKDSLNFELKKQKLALEKLEDYYEHKEDLANIEIKRLNNQLKAAVKTKRIENRSFTFFDYVMFILLLIGGFTIGRFTSKFF